MTSMQEDIASMKTEIGSIKESQKDMANAIEANRQRIDRGLNEIKTMLQDMPSEFDKRYASKTVEIAVYAFLGAIAMIWLYSTISAGNVPL